MKMWEYKRINKKTVPTQFMVELNDLGSENWEVIQYNENTKNGEVLVFLKRKLNDFLI